MCLSSSSRLPRPPLSQRSHGPRSAITVIVCPDQKHLVIRDYPHPRPVITSRATGSRPHLTDTSVWGPGDRAYCPRGDNADGGTAVQPRVRASETPPCVRETALVPGKFNTIARAYSAGVLRYQNVLGVCMRMHRVWCRIVPVFTQCQRIGSEKVILKSEYCD